MAGAGDGGPVRLAILIASIAGLIVLGVKTGGGQGAAASHGMVGRSPGTVAAVGDRLYAFGGSLASGKASGLVQEYDIATEHSVIAARLPQPLTRSSAVTLDSFVYLLGGISGGSPSTAILRFNPWQDAVAP